MEEEYESLSRKGLPQKRARFPQENRDECANGYSDEIPDDPFEWATGLNRYTPKTRIRLLRSYANFLSATIREHQKIKELQESAEVLANMPDDDSCEPTLPIEEAEENGLD